MSSLTTSFFLSASSLKPLEDPLQIVRAQGIPQILESFLKGVTPGMLPQDQKVLIQADVLGSHDLIGGAFLQDPVLVNPGFMGKGVGTHDGLVGRHHQTGDPADQPAGGIDLSPINAVV